MPGKKGPSRNMVRRLAEVAPENLARENEELRRDRDALKQALSMKIGEHVRTLTLGKNDILIFKPPTTNPMISTESLAEVGLAMAQSLRARAGWEGTILIEAGALVERMKPEEEQKLFDVLKKKQGDGNLP
jgi:hypothetical protein